MKYGYINVKAIKKLAATKEKRIGSDFLSVLNLFVACKVEAACHVHNGGKKTLDCAVAGFVGIKP